MAKSQKKGKKVWIKIMAPAEFNGIELGESYVYEPESLIGKKLDVNLSMFPLPQSARSFVFFIEKFGIPHPNFLREQRKICGIVVDGREEHMIMIGHETPCV